MVVRGRLYIPGDAVRSWRSSSVPVDDLRSPMVDANMLHKVQLIKSHAVQDADAIKSASRRHDLNFLNDVSNKLAVVSQPRPYYRETTPAYTSIRYPVSQPVQPDYRRRTLYAAPVTDYEVTNYLAGGPMPYRRTYRGTSVPPVSHSSGQGPVFGRVSVIPFSSVPSYKSHVPQTNNHVSNHYSVYRPSRYSYAPAVTSVQPNYRRASLAAVPAYKSLYDDVDEILSTPTRHRVTSRRYGDSEELDVEWPSIRPMTSLKGRAQSVQRQLDGIPEFHVYSPGRPRAASTVPSYTSAPAPLPSKTYTPSASSYSGGTSNSLPSSGSAPSAPRKASRPPVSEARRKVRDLLCRSKNNPHYYDGY